MTVMTDKPLEVRPVAKRWYDRVLVPEMWGTVAISVMWLAVLFDGIYGPDIVTSSNDGSAMRLPSAVVIAIFAFIATVIVARRVFGRRDDADPRRLAGPPPSRPGGPA